MTETYLTPINEQDLRTYIGNNAEYFIQARTALLAGERPRWNWAACGLAPFWFAYRKCWGWMGLAFLVGFVPYAFFITPFVFGAYGTRWYLEHCVKQITRIQHLQKNPKLYGHALREQGGTSALAVLLVLAVSLIVSGWVALTLLPSDLLI